MEKDYLLGDRLQELTVAICQELPDGWMIRIGIDNGLAGVTLVDPNDEEHDVFAPQSQSLTITPITVRSIACPTPKSICSTNASAT